MKACTEYQPQTKYTVQVFSDSPFGFLNVDRAYKRPFLDTKTEGKTSQTAFTQEELNRLKQRVDLTIDWDKAIIKPAVEK